MDWGKAVERMLRKHLYWQYSSPFSMRQRVCSNPFCPGGLFQSISFRLNSATSFQAP